MRELKHLLLALDNDDMRRTLPRVRELKLMVITSIVPDSDCRTLPRVRELKPTWTPDGKEDLCRTLPRVRELKLRVWYQALCAARVAPFPGCVN